MVMDSTMERGPLMLIPTFFMVATMDMVLATMVMVLAMDMAMDSTMERGPLMLSPRLMLIPTFSMEDMEDMDMEDIMSMDSDMDLDTGDTTGDKSLSVTPAPCSTTITLA